MKTNLNLIFNLKQSLFKSMNCLFTCTGKHTNFVALICFKIIGMDEPEWLLILLSVNKLITFNEQENCKPNNKRSYGKCQKTKDGETAHSYDGYDEESRTGVFLTVILH